MKYQKFFEDSKSKMELLQENINKPFLILFILIAYLFVNTGIHSDEYTHVMILGKKNLKDIIIPYGNFKQCPIEYYLLAIWYHFMSLDSQIFPCLLKALYGYLSIYMTFRFFSIFINSQNAFMVAILFFFYPSHDATAYHLLSQYLTITISSYLYAYYLIYTDRIKIGFLVAIFAAFISYASPAIAGGLFVLFMLQREYKKGIILFMPEIFFVIYFTKYLPSATHTGVKFNLIFFIKQLVIQFFTFIDATIGPSIWLKIYYSFFQLSILSVIIGIILTIVFYYTKIERDKLDNKLLMSLIVVVLTGFAMFSYTGSNPDKITFYPQLAFGLGNRTTVYGSLLLAYIIVIMPMPKKIQTIFFGVLIFSILGLSDHWKSFEKEKEKVIVNMSNTDSLRDYSNDRILFVAGHRYSNYGKMSHINFFSEGWLVDHIIRILFNREYITTLSIIKRYKYIDGNIVDLKGNIFIEKVDGYINVYDSDINKLFKLQPDKINEYIQSLPDDNCHWVSMIKNKYINDMILTLIPSMRYSL